MSDYFDLEQVMEEFLRDGVSIKYMRPLILKESCIYPIDIVKFINETWPRECVKKSWWEKVIRSAFKTLLDEDDIELLCNSRGKKYYVAKNGYYCIDNDGSLAKTKDQIPRLRQCLASDR